MTSARTVATFAEQAQSPPSFIFPFMGPASFSVANSEQFQYLMYRPLYWFGQGTAPMLNPSLSLAQPPVYSSDTRTVTIHLNGYRWSDGEALTARDVLFWLGMLHAEKSNWGDYAPGALPDDIEGVSVTSPVDLTIHLTAGVNTDWFTYDELSQITPMPDAWDVTAAGGAPGSGGCATAPYGSADAACTAVYTFLSTQAGYDPANPGAPNTALSTYATNPLWQVVDGPFHLTKFDAAGDVTMEPNPSYSGPVKATLRRFQEVPFASDRAEFDALVAGRIDVGYLPAGDVTRPTTDALEAGPNNPRLAEGYTLDPTYGWAISYVPLNFDSTGDGGAAGAIFRQLYFRQAMQLLVDQQGYNRRINKGYGVETVGPVPTTPATSFDAGGVTGDPHPYDQAMAVHLLQDHGWNVVPRGTDTCLSPGAGAHQCGAGIPAGAKLAFDLPYAAGTDTAAQILRAERSSWGSAGISITLTEEPLSTITASITACSGPGCSWEMASWGAGWVFAPDYYPTGEPVFQTGASSNYGSYSDPTNDANIAATVSTQTSLARYQDYLAEQLPVIFQPTSAAQLTEVARGLGGVLPQNSLQSINPEDWRFRG